MDYRYALRLLNDLVNYEKVTGYDYDLDGYRNFLKQFSSPELKLKNVILVAGTKGKGSTCTMIESALRHCGYRTGLFTSPHLIRVNERIKVNNQAISNQDFARIAGKVLGRIHRTKGARSFFEAITTIAFLYFIKKDVDFTILEVGLGGRLDATNVTRPIITVITRIGYDHTHLLGKRLSEIAMEKAGIIRTGCPIVISRQRPVVERILRKISNERKARLFIADQMDKIKVVCEDISGTTVKFDDSIVRLKMPGIHQFENFLTVVRVMELIKEMGYDLLSKDMLEGIAEAICPARIQVYSKRPLVILDGAHNPESFMALFSFLKKVKCRRLFIIFGISRDKDGRVAYEKIFPLAHEIVLTSANFPRARPPSEILQEVGGDQYYKIIPTVKEAINRVSSRMKSSDCLLIFGSFYVVGEALKYLSSNPLTFCNN